MARPPAEEFPLCFCWSGGSGGEKNCLPLAGCRCRWPLALPLAGSMLSRLADGRSGVGQRASGITLNPRLRLSPASPHPQNHPQDHRTKTNQPTNPTQKPQKAVEMMRHTNTNTTRHVVGWFLRLVGTVGAVGVVGRKNARGGWPQALRERASIRNQGCEAKPGCEV